MRLGLLSSLLEESQKRGHGWPGTSTMAREQIRLVTVLVTNPGIQGDRRGGKNFRKVSNLLISKD